MFYNTWPVGTRSGRLAWRHHPGTGRWQWDGVIGDASCRAHDDDPTPTVGSALRLPHFLCLGRWLAMPIFAPPFLANHRTFGHFDLWTLRPLDTSTSGHFELWPLQPLATSSSGHFNLWTFRHLAFMNSPCLSLLATFGQFDVWTIRTRGPYELMDIMNSGQSNLWPIWISGLNDTDPTPWGEGRWIKKRNDPGSVCRIFENLCGPAACASDVAHRRTVWPLTITQSSVNLIVAAVRFTQYDTRRVIAI